MFYILYFNTFNIVFNIKIQEKKIIYVSYLFLLK